MLSCPLQFDYINEIYNTLFRSPLRSAWIVVLMLFSGTRYPNNHRWMSLRRCRAHLLLKASCAVISASLSKCFMITVTTVNCCYSTHVLLTACNLHQKKTPSLLSVKEGTHIKLNLDYITNMTIYFATLTLQEGGSPKLQGNRFLYSWGVLPTVDLTKPWIIAWKRILVFNAHK